MQERKRERKTEVVKAPIEPLISPGGEGVISKEDLRIKIRTIPQIGDFKTRSYLNFTASIPLRFNRATGYYEPAELGDIVTARTHNYFYSTEPAVLVDAGWYDSRVNKRRHTMSALYDEAGMHLNILSLGPKTGICTAGSVIPQTFGQYRAIRVDSTGRIKTTVMASTCINVHIWKDKSVLAGEVSSVYDVTGLMGVSIIMKSDVANTITLQICFDDINWYNFISYDLLAGEQIADCIWGSFPKIRVIVKNAGTVTVGIYGYGLSGLVV